jgi:serine O-acetyltransferase
MYPPVHDFSLISYRGVGPGLFIQHGRSTGVIVQEMGSNCWINQLVSIGFKQRNSNPPVLGNNVVVFAGARIYGDIRIGDNVIIGANAVVTKDVPPNCTVAGVPARIIKRDGRRVDEPL